MAIRANRAMVRDGEVSVVEGGAEPVRGGVASIAGGRVPGGDVIRHAAAKSLRAVPFRQVASIADRIRRSERIVVADMAIGASLDTAGSGNDVPASQCPSGGAVIKLAVGPVDGVMTRGAHGGGEIGCHVIGHRTTERGGAVPVRGVAIGTPAVASGQAVIVAGVALIAVRDDPRRRHLVITS